MPRLQKFQKKNQEKKIMKRFPEIILCTVSLNNITLGMSSLRNQLRKIRTIGSQISWSLAQVWKFQNKSHSTLDSEILNLVLSSSFRNWFQMPLCGQGGKGKNIWPGYNWSNQCLSIKATTALWISDGISEIIREGISKRIPE